MNKNMLRVEELAILLQVSVNTINAWYRFKKQEPDNEYAKLLPDYIRVDSKRSTRYWNQEDVWKFIEFRAKLPKGRNGVMGNITQKYIRKKTPPKKKGR